MLDGLSLCFPGVITFCEGESFSHQILVYNRIQVCLLEEFALALEQVLDNFWVLDNHANDSRVDDEHDWEVSCVERLSVVFDVLKEPSSTVDDRFFRLVNRSFVGEGVEQISKNKPIGTW